jgi:hypothetical protein
VIITLGPKGRNVVFEKSTAARNDSTPLLYASAVQQRTNIGNSTIVYADTINDEGDGNGGTAKAAGA